MDPLRLVVIPRGKGFAAESRDPAVTALGSSAEEATENARLAALALFAKGLRPNMLIVRLNEPGLCTIVMQPLEKAFSITADTQPEWRYIASVTNDGGPKKAASE
jgi:hypothetical protein